ncbi:hypothetical protein Pmani_031512 [Petrolisthes manimaculis]|uniref:Uncharacterized protein n=1 Tax=Petrolisthes manimaculis TaxID=1843537 RepID=A0AAE1TSC3_9EUCA|nr:hypothetical protein Pmani_031512 [Petrolisthes manimaculis]
MRTRGTHGCAPQKVYNEPPHPIRLISRWTSRDTTYVRLLLLLLLNYLPRKKNTPPHTHTFKMVVTSRMLAAHVNGYPIDAKARFWSNYYRSLKDITREEPRPRVSEMFPTPRGTTASQYSETKLLSAAMLKKKKRSTTSPPLPKN